LADFAVLVAAGPQFVVGGVLQREQGIVRTGQGLKDLV
jgi:hypothetical protein